MPFRAERALVAALLALAGCAETPTPRTATSSPLGRGPVGKGVSDVPVRIGPPYTVGGRTFTPADDRNYDEVGIASIYGDRESGRTASGERFRADAVTAAHPTLPLPSYVEVTSLETGRTILVRVNDRGPFARGRIIDLSPRAAQLLGQTDGLLRVRVRRAIPPESDRAALRAGQAAPARLSASPQLLAALNARLDGTLGRTLHPLPPLEGAPQTEPQSAEAMASADRLEAAPPPPPPLVHPQPPKRPLSPIPTSASGTFFVQLGAFSDRARAESIARSVSARTSSSGGVWRVRLGPYRDRGAAADALAQVRARGYRDAALVRDPAAP